MSSKILSDIEKLHSQIDLAIQAKKLETANLFQMQSQVDSISISNTITQLHMVDTDINSKFSEYVSLIKSTNDVATDVYSKLQASSKMLTNVQSTMAALEHSIRSMCIALSSSPTETVQLQTPVASSHAEEKQEKQEVETSQVLPVLEPVAEEEVLAPVAAEEVLAPVAAEEVLVPVAAEEVLVPVAEEEVLVPVAEEEVNSKAESNNNE